MAAQDAISSSPTTTLELSDQSGSFKSHALDVTTEELCDSNPSQSEIDAQCSTSIEQETCVVCGDHAPGRNFGVVSCGSCKAFFRRNALKSKIAPCLFSGSCSVKKATRSFCPPCRLKKCLTSGMMTERIMSHDAKKQRKELIERNRNRQLDTDAPLSTSCGEFDQDMERSSAVGHQQSVGSGSSITSSVAEIRSSNDACAQLPVAQVGAGELSMIPVATERWSHCTADVGGGSDEPPVGEDTTIKLVPSSRLAAMFQRVQTALASSVLHAQRRLVSGDQAELGYLTRCYQSTVGVDPSIAAPEPPEGFSAQLFATRTSNLIRQMVLFAKEMPHFAGQLRSTQIRLLRAGAMSCILLRSAELLDLASASWVNHSGDKLSLEVLKQVSSQNSTLDDFFIDHLTLSTTVKQLVPADAGGQSDGMVFALLLIIVLLSPEHVVGISDSGAGASSSSDPAVVSDAQLHYVKLLRRHLEATYSFQLCSKVLPELLQRITVIKRYSARQNSGFMSCLAVRNDPLCQEVLGE